MPPKGGQAQAGKAREPSLPAVPSPGKGKSIYTNKDGSKYIAVPKTGASIDSANTSPSAVPPVTNKTAPPAPATEPAAPPVNRKKQKRRAKLAAKAAAEQGLQSEQTNGVPSQTEPEFIPKTLQLDPDVGEEEDLREFPSHTQSNGYGDAPDNKPGKSRKKKKKKGANVTADDELSGSLPPAQYAQSPRPQESGIAREKIWNTSSQEERERIKQFWLGLGEDERKSLVKVEKDAVLRKMKEQQKHTCSCTVCGRKRIAIEEELEGLYDAYYEELEIYANHPRDQGPPMLGPGSINLPPADPLALARAHSSASRVVEHLGDVDEEEEELEEEYSDEEDLDEEDYSEDEPLSDEQQPRDYAQEFFNFGNSLTVQGGILTVADDLLKNDGKKFIEMMEQLAERRMAREQDAKDQYSRGGGYGHTDATGYTHNHPQAPDDEEYDDEEEVEDDYESQDEEFEDEEDTMTEEQRMEEGRRMFQIFAARMFEQRVLTAYKEKVAKERQQKLIEELEEEDEKEAKAAAKKAREAQKKKDRADKKKQAAAEEKARKEAEKAAEEAARLAEEVRRLEEQKARAEEKRKKKEAQKKAEEEEKLRKESERLRKAAEAKERQAEQERKARETKERDKKAKEEARAKEKEARERKELEARERKDQQDRDREQREKEARPQKGKDKHGKQANNSANSAQKVGPALPAVPLPINLAKRPSQQSHQASAGAIPALPREPSVSLSSPQIPVATPAIPKGPIAMRPRQASQQDHASSQGASGSASAMGSSQNASPHPVTPVHTSPGNIGPSSKAGSSSTQSAAPHSSSATSPLNNASKPATIHATSPFNGVPMSGGMPFPPGMGPPVPPGLGNRLGHDPALFNAFAPPFRPGPGPMSMPVAPPPGLAGPSMGRPFQVSHQGPPQPPPGFPVRMAEQGGPMQHVQGFTPKDSVPVASHSRQGSSGYDGAPISMPPSNAAVSRPAPIGRPGSVVHGQRAPSGSSAAASELAALDPTSEVHLGSRALLDDSDEPLPDFGAARQNRVTSAMHSASSRSAFPSPFGMGSDSLFPPQFQMWSPMAGSLGHNGPGAPFGGPPPPPGFQQHANSGGWPTAPSAPSVFGGGQQGSLGRPSQPRTVVIRQMLCRAWKDLFELDKASISPAKDGFFALASIKMRVDQMNTGEPVTDPELLDMCDTEGNASNGGGSFDVKRDGISNQAFVRWNADLGGSDSTQRAVGAPGEIGSPSLAQGSFSSSATSSLALDPRVPVPATGIAIGAPGAAVSGGSR